MLQKDLWWKKKKTANIFNEINGVYNIYIFKILELIKHN